MADSDHTAPARVKATRGETPRGSYVRRTNKTYGRPKTWRQAARAMAKANRQATRSALRAGADDTVPYRARGASWQAY